MSEKLFYSMGEIAEMFDVNQSLIRHWESQFSVLKPQRNKKGNRLFSPRDVENLKLIYHLVKERGMTLEGAKKAMRKPLAQTGVERDAELMERLQRIRSLLVEVREDLKVGEGEILASDEVAVEALPRKKAAVSKPAPKPKAEPQPDSVAESLATETVEMPAAEALVTETPAEEPQQKAPRKPRRKKEEAENKELFAFYEQSLF